MTQHLSNSASATLDGQRTRNIYFQVKQMVARSQQLSSFPSLRDCFTAGTPEHIHAANVEVQLSLSLY